MKVIEATRTRLILKPSQGEETRTAFCFDIDVIPSKPVPKSILFISRINRGRQWGMTWEKFGKETVFIPKDRRMNSVVLIRKDNMNLCKFKLGNQHPSAPYKRG